MENRKINFILVLSALILASLACNVILPPDQPATMPAQIQPILPQPQTNLPLTEAGVPRISVEEAKAAFDSGEAVIVDVRNVEAYAEGHVAGALSIPLADIEFNPSGVALDKTQWIITYCT